MREIALLDSAEIGQDQSRLVRGDTGPSVPRTTINKQLTASGISASPLPSFFVKADKNKRFDRKSIYARTVLRQNRPYRVLVKFAMTQKFWRIK